MTVLEDLISFALVLISILSPSPEVSSDDLLKQENYPHVYVIAQEDLAMSVCGCPCGVSGLYVGVQDVDGVVGQTIIMGGTSDGYMFTSNNWTSGLFHELIHLRQNIEGKMAFTPYLNKEELAELHVELERDAYMHENIFRMVYNLPLHNPDDMANHSTELTTGQAKCFKGYTPIPKKERLNPVDLIMFYDEGIIEVYRNNWQ